MTIIGRVRPLTIKRTAKDLLEQYGDRFTEDFGKNKQVLGEIAEIPSKHLRNRIAGYITHIKQISETS